MARVEPHGHDEGTRREPASPLRRVPDRGLASLAWVPSVGCAKRGPMARTSRWPTMSIDSSPRAYGMKRHLARACGVKLTSDIYERACDLGIALPLVPERRRRLACIAQTGVLFIHVPKNAGMSISQAIYGRQIKHSTIRYYQRVAPALAAQATSFAVVRDPVERFLSAYAYARGNGTEDNAVSLPFRDMYRSFRCMDEALDHIEGAPSIYHVDHIFRPQVWYVLDTEGNVAVKTLIPLGELDATLKRLLPNRAFGEMPRLNRSAGADRPMPREADRIRRLFERDVALWESVVRQGAT